MLTVEEIRLQNLEELVAKFRSAAALIAAAAERGVEIEEVYISQIRNRTPVRRKDKSLGPPRAMGSEVARKIEKGLGLEHGWMDNLHTAKDVLAKQLLDLYEQLSVDGKHDLLRAANERFNVEYPSVPSPANPWARAPAKHD